MPIYEYKCQACGHVFDEMLTVEEGVAKLKKACPECKKRKLSRPPAAPAVHMRYSLMHPRHMRGQRKIPKGKKT